MSAHKFQFPYKMNDVKPHEKKELDKLFIDGKDPWNYLRVGPKGYILYKKYATMASDIYNMDLRPGDIFVTSYLRSGTTWGQELVWLVANDVDFETAKTIPLVERFPFLEYSMFYEESMQNELFEISNNKEGTKKLIDTMEIPVVETLKTLPGPRFVKTHLPMSLLPPYMLDKSKVVYVARDPRDVVVSSYHHSILFRERFGLRCNFKQFWDIFRHDLYILCPYFEHVKEAWALRHHPNMLFLFYEELSQDMPEALRRVADFLGKKLTDDQVLALCSHLKFENFKNNKSVNREAMKPICGHAENETFIRKGKVGGWREYFTGDMAQELQDWIDKNLQGSDLVFPSMKK